jgi:hypothetical protein
MEKKDLTHREKYLAYSLAAGISVAVAYPIYKYLENRLMDEIFEFIDYFKMTELSDNNNFHLKESSLFRIL